MESFELLGLPQSQHILDYSGCSCWFLQLGNLFDFCNLFTLVVSLVLNSHICAFFIVSEQLIFVVAFKGERLRLAFDSILAEFCII